MFKIFVFPQTRTSCTLVSEMLEIIVGPPDENFSFLTCLKYFSPPDENFLSSRLRSEMLKIFLAPRTRTSCLPAPTKFEIIVSPHFTSICQSGVVKQVQLVPKQGRSRNWEKGEKHEDEDLHFLIFNWISFNSSSFFFFFFSLFSFFASWSRTSYN